MIVGVASFLVTVIFYLMAKWLYRWKPNILLSPILITPFALVILLIMTDTDFESYNKGGHWLSYMLQPATIAFAIPLSKHFALIKKHATEILASVFTGSVIAIISTYWLAKALDFNEQMINSLVPHSTTTPIAMLISDSIGGVPTITAVAVILTGILGFVMGPHVIRICNIQSDIARGVLFGTSAHGVGTSKAFEFGSISGTVSSISMILTAIISVFITPWLLAIF